MDTFAPVTLALPLRTTVELKSSVIWHPLPVQLILLLKSRVVPDKKTSGAATSAAMTMPPLWSIISVSLSDLVLLTMQMWS